MPSAADLLGDRRRVLVTGGAGFIGGAVVRRLLRESTVTVFNLDKMGYASDLTSIEEVLSELGEAAAGRQRLQQVDLSDAAAVEAAVREADPDLVMHLAAESHVDRSISGPGVFIESNVSGPGNARTEELVIEMSEHLSSTPDMIPLMNIISNYFSSLKAQYRWGTNPYYYLSGKYKIHPSFVQQMLSDVRFDDADILAVVNSLKDRDASKFDQDTLKLERDMYNKAPLGTWSPSSILKHRDVLFIGPGNSVEAHLSALINYIQSHDVFVIAFNAISTLDSKYVDASIACHPVRLLADIDFHCRSDIQLITPYSMLSSSLQAQFSSKIIYDFGLSVNPESFEFHDTFCVCPSSLVLSYALAVCVSGGAVSLKLAGFDGYQPGDPRNDEVERILDQFMKVSPETSFFSITPTTYKNLPSLSIYAL